MQSVREVVGVAVDERPVVLGEVFSCCLVFSKVPAGGQFGLQSLIATSEDKIKLLPDVTCMVKKDKSVYTNPDFPQEVADDVKS